MLPSNERLLKRRLYLQRYITQLQNEVIDLNESGDKLLIDTVRSYIEGATARELKAFANLRKTHPSAKAVLSEIHGIIQGQMLSVSAHIVSAVDDLVEREGKYTAAALGNKLVSMRGVATQPVGGTLVSDAIAAAYGRYETRVFAEISQAVAANGDFSRVIAGTAPQQRRDGLYYWRNARMLRPNIDVIVNGASSNAANKVFEAYRIAKVSHTATLDYRACVSCRAAEEAGPYDLGRQPVIPIHPRCRCVNLPVIADEENRRPFVRDSRSVKNIPLDDREGKTGQTRANIETFFERMSDADLLDYLGPGKYELWKAGKITSVKQLVDEVTLRPLRLDELPN